MVGVSVVSIPYRYGTTEESDTFYGAGFPQCQFLIGMVRQKIILAQVASDGGVSIPYRYGTTIMEREYGVLSSCQFLIGMVRQWLPAG